MWRSTTAALSERGYNLAVVERLVFRGLLARSFRRRLRGEGVGEAVAAIEGDEVVHRQVLGTAHDGEGGARVGVAEEQAIGGEADARCRRTPPPSLHAKFVAWYGALPPVSRDRRYSMSEFEKALGGTQGKYISPVLLELGWTRKRIWSTRGQYLPYWAPPPVAEPVAGQPAS